MCIHSDTAPRFLADQLPGDASGAGVVPHDSGHAIPSAKEGERRATGTEKGNLTDSESTYVYLSIWFYVYLHVYIYIYNYTLWIYISHPNSLLWFLLSFTLISWDLDYLIDHGVCGVWQMMITFWLGKSVQKVSWDGIGIFFMAHLARRGTSRYPRTRRNRSSASGEWRESLRAMVVSNLFRSWMVPSSYVEFPTLGRWFLMPWSTLESWLPSRQTNPCGKTHGGSLCCCYSHVIHWYQPSMHHKHSCILSKSPESYD